jgi:isopentenyldiphosphate isomerase
LTEVEEELVDIYDENLRKIGKDSRYEAHVKGEWHLNFHCWVVRHRDGGALLFQIRSKKKPTFPGKLDSTVGGHYKADEKLSGVVREAKEELGLQVKSRELVHLGRRIDIASVGGMPKREIANVFLLPRDAPLEDYRPDPEEVEGLVEIPIRKGLELFSGRVKSFMANGIRWEPKAGRRIEVTRTVERRSFVPKVDSYYLTLFIMAQRYVAGEKRYLSI